MLSTVVFDVVSKGEKARFEGVINVAVCVDLLLLSGEDMKG